LCLAIDPLKILDDQQQRLLSRFSAPHRVDAVNRSLPTLEGVEHLPGGVRDGDVEEGQQRRQRRGERRGEGNDLPCDLLPDRADAIAIVDVEIPPEQCSHGRVAWRLAIRYRSRLEHEPAP
jgi:hypothetical protein